MAAWFQCGRDGWLRFNSRVDTFVARTAAEVTEVLERANAAAQRGSYAVGFLSYEAAAAFDEAFVTRPSAGLPLAYFEVYEGAERAELPTRETEESNNHELDHELKWQPTLDRELYRVAVQRIRERIAAGDTYQVNFTWRLVTEFDADPWTFFLDLANRDQTRYAAFVDTGEHAVCSFSPELFFRLDGESLECRPMKGTARRGPYRVADLEQAHELANSPKERAENVMIVDMIRNDLGRVARAGTVETTRLFDIETYPTVHQMTSTVTAKTGKSLTEILTALFPCASITGAPKVETMGIIAELEDRPRGIYTGAIGYIGPERQALFNVAIRTVHVDRAARIAEYGTGGGIVWDSEPDAEYTEGRTKTLVLAPKPPEFQLLETLRWSPEEGYVLLGRHLERLADSAHFLGFSVDPPSIHKALEALARDLPKRPHRVRLLVSRDGSSNVEAQPLEWELPLWRIALAGQPIDSGNRFLHHKTTHRQVYEDFRAIAPEADDVLLWNERRELTETTLANVALRLDGRWYTPPVSCGLLAGTQRAELIALGDIAERVLTFEDLERAEELALVNSVRGWIPAQLEESSKYSSSFDSHIVRFRP